MKRNKEVFRCGPYKVVSMSQDRQGVRIVLYPAFSVYGDWVEGRLKDEGGGPGIFTAMALANSFEEFLNQGYSPDAVAAWHKSLNKALEPEAKGVAMIERPLYPGDIYRVVGYPASGFVSFGWAVLGEDPNDAARSLWWLAMADGDWFEWRDGKDPDMPFDSIELVRRNPLPRVRIASTFASICRRVSKFLRHFL